MTQFSTPDEFSQQIIQLNSPAGGAVKISKYAAHVLSWVTPDGREHLFLSPKAEFRPGAAIRGGVPVIFPQFAGLGSLPKHGFARTQAWELARSTADSAVFWLSETKESQTIWPHHFLAEYLVRVGKEKLEMVLTIINTDPAPFVFTAALHTYLSVSDVAKSTIAGLEGLTYRDSVHGGQEEEEISEQVGFDGETDRIYLDSPSFLELLEDGGQPLSILSDGFADTVIWNPGSEKCALLSDMEPDGYRKFVCVEAAAIGRPIRLAPGATWIGRQILSL